jgi:DNA helicase IV
VPAAPPGAKARALAEEEAHVGRVHDRVEELRRRADERVAEASADRSGSTFQARFERDVTAHHHAARAARYTFGDVESLVFGRLDLDDGDHLHIGRVSVVDAEGDVVLVDWRAPAAAAFYQATAAQPQGVARRRMLTTRGREVRDLDDELLDVDAAERLGLAAVTGQGALLAALSRTRTGTMRDIVATIQADQDRIIRAPATGTLVVSGGPGTGKTVVALHRVASLLYRDRERFEGRGVLVIGPTAAFTEYTSRVLPSLGEDRAVQRPIAALAPAGVTVRGWDELEVARIKGDLRMAEVLRRLLGAALPPIPPDTRLSFDGVTSVIDAGQVDQVRRRLLERVRADRRGASYHDRSRSADDALKAVLWRAWRGAARRQGRQVPDERDGLGFDTALEDSAQITMLRRCYWPELTPDGVLAELATGEVDLGGIASDLLGTDEVATLRASWAEARGWTIDDVALLDELASLLGPPGGRVEPAEPRDDGGIRLMSDALRVEVAEVDVEADDYRDFAHVVVDEAQDLTPMQWRAVARRGPYASWTVVGDLAQRSRVAAPHTWQDVAQLIGRREVSITALSVNYRTPAEIAALAREVLAAAGHDPASAPAAVRETGEAPRLVRTARVAEVAVAEVARAVEERDGTVAVIAPDAEVADLAASLDRAIDEPVRDRIRVLDPRTAKGLEFDDVVIVHPEAIVASSQVGTHQLYVAVTRATRALTLVAEPDTEPAGSGPLRAVGGARRRAPGTGAGHRAAGSGPLRAVGGAVGAPGGPAAGRVAGRGHPPR